MTPQRAAKMRAHDLRDEADLIAFDAVGNILHRQWLYLSTSAGYGYRKMAVRRLGDRIRAAEREARAKAIEECAQAHDALETGCHDEADDARREGDIERAKENLWRAEFHKIAARNIRLLAETIAPAVAAGAYFNISRSATGGSSTGGPAATSETTPDACRPTNAEIAKVVGWLLEQYNRNSPATWDSAWQAIGSYLEETLEAHTP